MDKSPNRHIDFLDPLRGIAILLVFIFHSVGPAFGRDELPWGHWFRDFNVSTPFIFLIPATFGWVGVAIFFVVSGFCIHLSFSRLPQWSLFFQRRFFRIYPPYLITLLFFAVIFPTTRLAFTSWHSAGQFVSHLFLFHNIDDRSFFGINPSYWSIAVEVQLYALYPILIMLARRFGWRRTLIGLAMIEITLRFTDGVLFTFNGTGLPRWISGSFFSSHFGACHFCFSPCSPPAWWPKFLTKRSRSSPFPSLSKPICSKWESGALACIYCTNPFCSRFPCWWQKLPPARTSRRRSCSCFA